MVPPQYGSLHVVVALFSAALSLLLLPVAKRRYVRLPLAKLPGHLCQQCRNDIRRGGRWASYWWWLLAWATMVSALHFGGREFGLYLQFHWWDLMTHSMSGAGVAGILLVGLRATAPARPSLSWVVVALLTIGAGFEVYEYVFKSFWHTWTLSVYVQDTMVDLTMGCLGGCLALLHYRSRVEVSSTDAASLPAAQLND